MADDDLYLDRRYRRTAGFNLLDVGDPLEQHGLDPVTGHALIEPRSKRQPINPDGSCNY